MHEYDAGTAQAVTEALGLTKARAEAVITNPTIAKVVRYQIAMVLMSSGTLIGIPREMIDEHLAAGKPIMMTNGHCVGCGTADYSQVALRNHDSLPKGSLVPLCEHCEPIIY